LLAHVTPAVLSDARKLLAETPTMGSGRTKPFHKSNATINRYFASLSACFSKAVEWGWLERNPCQLVKRERESRGRTRFLDADERERLLEAARESTNPHLYAWIVLSLTTGGRSSEILGLEWRDFDAKRKTITFHETKNGESRTVPVAGEALEILIKRSRVKDIRTNLIFPSPTDPRRHIDVRSAWDVCLKKAGISDFRPHDLRHCAASYLAMSGASLLEIARILGHKSLSMVNRYSHLTDGHLNEVVERMVKTKLGGSE
jgi:integrase